ncbi:Uncharacterised protein [Porphyromonas cangingivalis]|nr:Uncharacterised protein [Porphyromonas cangingivalis]
MFQFTQPGWAATYNLILDITSDLFQFTQPGWAAT